MQQSLNITGSLYHKYDVVERGEWKSIEFVILDNSNPSYPQKVKLRQSNRIDDEYDNVDRFKFFELGQDLTVEFNIRGIEYDAKDKSGVPTGEKGFFTQLDAWKVRKLEQRAAGPIQDETDCPI